MKTYADKRRHTRQSKIKIGDKVLLKQRKRDMLTPNYDPRPYVVISVKGSMVTARRGDETKTRNSSHCKVLKFGVPSIHIEQEGSDIVDWDQASSVSQDWPDFSTHADGPVRGYPQTDDDELMQPQQIRRSSRNRTSTRDTLYKDFVIDY